MVSTKKVTTLTAGIIAIDCMLAGMATAGLIGQGIGSMSETLSVALTLVVVLAALNTVLIRLHIKDWRERRQKSDRESERESEKLGDVLEKDMDVRTLLTKVLEKLDLHDEALTPLIEDLKMRKAKSKGPTAGRPWEESAS